MEQNNLNAKQYFKSKQPEKKIVVWGKKRGVCPISGKYAMLEPHHLWRRSIRPDLVNDKKNILWISHVVHVLATNDREFEKKLQEEYYPNPPKFKAKNEL